MLLSLWPAACSWGQPPSPGDSTKQPVASEYVEVSALTIRDLRNLMQDPRIPRRYRAGLARFESVERHLQSVKDYSPLFGDGTIWGWTRRYSICYRIFHRRSAVACNYDSATRRIAAIGPIGGWWGRHGKWYIADSNGDFQTVRYRYGYRRDSLRDHGGRRALAYYTFGFGGGRFPDCYRDSFAVVSATIAGCMVSPQDEIRAAVHNTVNDLIQLARFGVGWKRRMNALRCD